MFDAPINLIYGLVDPRTGAIRYVGQSTRGLDRPQEHWSRASCSDDDRSHRANWLRSLRRAGVRYEIVVLQYLRDDQPYDDIDAVECWWIAYGRSQGWDLTNTTDGGGGVRGFHHSEETRQHLSRTSRAVWSDPALLEAQATRHRGRRRSPETCRRISESKTGVPRPYLRGRISPLKGRPGRVQTEAEKLKRSLSMRGKKRGPSKTRGVGRSWVTRHNVTRAQRRRHQQPQIRINLLPTKKSEP